MAIKKKSVAKVSSNTLKIQDFLQRKKPGTEISYMDIQDSTGVTMDNRGKGYMRTALKRARLEYAPIIGYGIVLADSNTTMPLVIRKLNKIDKAVKRADRTHKNLQARFLESLTLQEQKQLLFVGAAFGAIRVAAENGRMIYSSKNKINSSINIPIPEYK